MQEQADWPSDLRLEAKLARPPKGKPFVIVRCWLADKLIYADPVRLEAADARRHFAEELLEVVKRELPDTTLTLATLETKLLTFGEPATTASEATPDTIEPDLSGRAEAPHRYDIFDGCLCIMPRSVRLTGNPFADILALGESVKPEPLTNFAATILEEIVRDDGSEIQTSFVIGGALQNGELLPKITVAAKRFNTLGWLTEKWGASPRVYSGKRAQVPLAIQFVSDAKKMVIYGHLGWRRLPDDRLVYLHGAGAVGAANVITDLAPDRLTRYRLPTQLPSPELLRRSMAQSLEFLNLADPHLTYILWALVWRAPLCEWLKHDVMVHVVGPSGRRKSTICAALLAHMGDFAQKDDLPGSWDHTISALERTSFLAKDALWVVDDLNPAAARVLQQDLDKVFARMAGNVGNQSGRRRLGGDLTTRLEYQPRGVVISSGEYMPTLAESRAARVLPVPSPEADMDVERLSRFQQALGLLPNAYVAYVDSLRSQDAALGAGLRRQFEADRALAMPELPQHARLAENTAQIALGLRFGLQFAASIGVLSEAQLQEHLDRGWQAIIDVARFHGQAIQADRPSQRFLDAISESIQMGASYLADRHSGAPHDGVANGTKVGWFDDQFVYLLPQLSYRLADERLRPRGGIGFGPNLLHRELAERGLLRPRPDARGLLTSMVRCEGDLTRVLIIEPTAFR